MGLLKRRPNSPYWWYDITVSGRRFRGSTQTSDRKTAEIIIAKIRSDLLIQQVTGQKPRMTLDAAAAKYLDEHAQYLASATDIARWLDSVVSGIGSAANLSTITAGQVAAYVATRRGAGLSNASINREIGALRALINRARDIWDIDTPKILWKKIILPESDERHRTLSDSEEDALFRALRPDYHAMVRFALYSGIRVSNVRELTWDQVSFSDGIIRLRVKSTKPGGKSQIIPITQGLAAILSAEQGRHETYVFTYVCSRNRTDPHSGQLQRRGERYPFTRDGWRKEWHAALTAAGIDDFRFHDLRHTAGDRLLRATGNLMTVKLALGHESTDTTRRYARMKTDDVRAAMEAVEARHNPATPAHTKNEKAS